MVVEMDSGRIEMKTLNYKIQMSINLKKKTKIYIDGSNTYHAQKKLGWLIDWVKVKKIISGECDILQWIYYVGLKEDNEDMKGFLRYLNHIGIDTVTKPLKKIVLEKDDPLLKFYPEGFVHKANFDVEITADILLDKSGINEFMIFSGDSDFTYLVKKLKDLGKSVIVYSSRATISWELKLASFKVIYIEDLNIKSDKLLR